MKKLLILITFLLAFGYANADNNLLQYFSDFNNVKVIGKIGSNNTYVITTDDNGRLLKPVYGSLSETYFFPNSATTPVGFSFNIYFVPNPSGLYDTIFVNNNGFVTSNKLGSSQYYATYIKFTNGGFGWLIGYENEGLDLEDNKSNNLSDK